MAVPLFRVHTSWVSSPSDEIQPLQHMNFVVHFLGTVHLFFVFFLVWAEWVLQFPSFGCVLHQLLCLCKTCDDFTHHDSTEMSEDRAFWIFQEAPCWGDAGRGGLQGVCRLPEPFSASGFTLYVQFMWVNLWYSARFPSLNQGGCHLVPSAHLFPSCALTHFFTVSSFRAPPAALGAVVFGHIVGHPVDFGCPALSQRFVELLAKLLQRLIIGFSQSQRVLRRKGIVGEKEED